MNTTAKLERDARVELNGEGEYVLLGRGMHEQRIYVVPQPIAWLRQKLTHQFTTLLAGATAVKANEGDDDAAAADDAVAQGLLDSLGGGLYDVLSVFMPGEDDTLPGLEQSMPRWRWDGYGSPTAAEAKQYDRAADGSPTAPQVKKALLVCMRLNEIDLVKHIAKLVDPTVLQLVVNRYLRERLIQSSPTLSSAATQGSDSQTSLMTSDRTSDASVDSPSPDSTA